MHHQFGDLLDDKGMTQLINEPTRNTNILDLVLINNPTLVSEVTVIPGISDHDCPVVTLYTKVTHRRKLPKRKIPQYHKAKWDQFSDHMKRIGEIILSKDDSLSVNEMWLLLSDGLKKGAVEFIPHKTSKKGTNLPWFTSKLKSLHNRRDRLTKKKRILLRNHQKVPDSLLQKLRDIKKSIQQSSRKAYWTYTEKLITPDEGDSNEYQGMKRFWSFIKYNRTDSSSISQLKTNEKCITDPCAIADTLNKQFESAFTQETDLPQGLLPDSSPHPDMPYVSITTAGVQKLLDNLKIHKAPGPDGITPRILKALAPVIAPSLTRIFQKSYETGEVPDDWLGANVVPVFNKGQRTDPGIYRPISLTSTCCKLMEHIITSSIMKHATTHNILYPLQFGFRSGRSCETQLTGFISDLLNSMHNSEQTDVLVLDMAKAFDKVGHRRLLKKLEYYGIRGSTNKWINSFLSKRSQTVVFEGSSSYTAPVKSGVPQGSVLGP